MVVRSRVLSAGSYLPARIVTNDELAKTIDTSDEWIRQRTGIRQRHIAAEGELTSDLAIAASRQALENAGLKGSDIDCIVLGTCTPDHTFPATATRVQHVLGAKGFALDVGAVCSGFVFALAAADNFIRLGQAKNALVIGAETFSRILDWKDRGTCVLFGDGAGAVVLEAQTQLGNRDDRGILATRIRSDGRFEELLYVDGGPGSTKTTGHLRMNGREVFRHAVQKISGIMEETLVTAGYAPGEVDLYVPHQANKRILDGIGKKLGIPPHKVVVSLAKHGNTSAASIPLALNQAFEDHLLKERRLVLMEAMGGGFTWGAALVRW